MINNQIKHKDKIQMINSLIAEIPFKTCYSTRVVIGSELFSPHDPMLPVIDSFLTELEEQEKDMYKEVVAKALSYTISRIKTSAWVDQNGCVIIDKFHYFKNSLNRNIDRVKKNIIGYNWIDSPNEDNLGSSDGVTSSDDSFHLNSTYVKNKDTDDLDDELPF